jgi:lysozyme
MLFGIDSASVADNKNPGWAQAKASGPASFVFLRSNYGDQADTAFKREWPRLLDAGITRGAYLFLRFPRGGKAAPQPDAQAQAMINTVGDLLPDDFPPAVDVEFPDPGRTDTGMSPADCLYWITVAVRVLAARYRTRPLIYTSGRVWRDDMKDIAAPELVDCPLWLAKYPFKPGPAMRNAAAFAGGRIDPPVPTPWGDADNWWFHQYQGDAIGYPGMTGKVDMNRFNPIIRGATGARVTWMQRRCLPPATKPTGRFGPDTEDALRAFQTNAGLVADGVVGPRTFARLCWRTPVGG